MDSHVRLCLSLAVLACAMPMADQPLAQTAGIEGIVLDAEGLPLDGATVSVQNRAINMERQVTTGADGRYRVTGLPPATYVIDAIKGNRASPVFEEHLPVGHTVRRDLTVRASLTEELDVTARPLLNSTDTEVAAVVGSATIESMPLINRDFTDLANIAPGVKPKASGDVDPTKNEEIYRPFTSGASGGRDINLRIDGGDNNDNVVGTWTQGYTAEAIQEFEIISEQYKAEYGRATAGVVNVITKSGTNEIDGTVFGLYRNEGFRKRNFSEVLAGSGKDESERTQLGFSAGGPVVRDKLFWFAAYENIEQTRPIAFSPTLTQYDRASDLAGRTFDNGLERDLYTIKLNGIPSGSPTLFARYSADENTLENDQGGATTPPERNGSSINDAWSAIGGWTWLGRGWLSEFTLHANDFENGITTPASGLARVTSESYLSDLVQFGANPNLPQSTFIAKAQVREDFTYSLGSHDLKFGAEWINVEFDDSNLGPTDSARVTFVFRPTVTPDQLDASPGDLSLVEGISFTDPSIIPGYDYNQIALYAQDTWSPNPEWSFNFGLRYDRDDGVFDTLRAGVNRQFYEAQKAEFADRFNRLLPKDPDAIAPRLGVVYRFDGQDRDILRASYGVFYDKVIANLTLFGSENLSPVAYPGLPGQLCTDATTGEVVGCAAGSDFDGPTGPLAPIPDDFSYGNWLRDVENGGPLFQWFESLVANLGPLETYSTFMMLPGPDWQWPRKKALALGWGHRFNSRWALDTNLIVSRGDRNTRVWWISSRGNTGVDPVSGTSENLTFLSDGKSRYRSLQAQLRGRTRNYDLILNLNVSRAEATSDIGAAPYIGGNADIFHGGNRRFVGPRPSENPACNTPGGPICVSEDDEWGRISGDQFIWASVYVAWRLPLGFSISGDMSYGSEIAFWPNAGYDWNRDGLTSGSEYVGNAGSGRGDDYFAANLRVARTFAVSSDVSVDAFVEVFNLTDQINYGLFVDQSQATPGGLANPAYGRPTGNFLGEPRTINVGARLRF